MIDSRRAARFRSQWLLGRHGSFWGIVVSLTICSGCQDGPELGEVEGRVTLDGSPLEGATVTFLPDSGGRPGTGKTNADGRYTLRFTGTKWGAPLGRHEVRVSTFAYPSTIEHADGTVTSHPMLPETLPAKYNQQSELSANVEPGMNEFNFDLTSE